MVVRKELNIIIITLIVGAMLITTGNAFAVTAFEGGFSGLIKTPTANVLPYNKAAVGYQHTDSANLASFNYGVYDSFELGLTNYWYDEDEVEDDDLFLNAKLQLMQENNNQPAAAMGVVNEDFYGVVSQNLDYGLRGHIGLGDGDFDGLFAGISKTLNPVTISSEGKNQTQIPVTTLMMEYIDEEFNAGARLKLTPQLNFNLALEDLSDLSAGINFETQF
ncbi:YjbH domain-containing protein [Sporohalobacter salinus]|uniref:YjbH domain-containing protein n=1 Tax=Sporohalobacter salinus TaxID=1494606 RepID=UPI001961D69E|nr:YjbH domain-containing protein [Sporohalobacter salinus]MBM7622920.1 hypothetical protein [Sporohalobacter salinus]